MATLPSPTQVAGYHSAIYEAYYNVVDPNGFGTVGGMEAARFLKRSGLSDVILSKIWDLSDPGGRGCLDKAGFFVALKLVALVQNAKDLTINNVQVEVPPPKMGDIPLPKPVKPPPPKNTPLITSLPPSAVDWTVKPSEREKYDKLFDSLQPTNGLIPGNKVKNVLMESKLPFDTLGKIWDLADQDKDGMLDRHEFVVAMHLVYKALDKFAIPSTLPPELMPPAKRKGSTPMGGSLISGLDGMKPEISAPPPAIPPMPVLRTPVVPPLIPTNTTVVPPLIPSSVAKPVQSVQPTVPWVVTQEEKAKSDALFIKSDIDKDGFVSGQEIKDVFLQSGVPQTILAQIWALCDIKQCGKLNNEQFALAMWFVARCLKGKDPPPTLTSEMVPPSFRTIKSADGLVENNNTRYSNPELDMISKDIEELAREKLILETDIAQKEADIKIKSGEIKNLQSELDTLAATLKQLENQKGEAQKRLNDLKAQKSEVDTQMEEIDAELETKQMEVDKLRVQAAEQAEMVASQEAELNSKKEQLEGLKQEEQRLEQHKVESMKRLEGLTHNLQETQFTISQAKALITQLEEQTRQMNDAIQACDSAIESGEPIQVPDAYLKINPEFRDPQYGKVGVVTNGENREDAFGSNDAFVMQNNVNNSSAFTNDPFQNDPFRSNSTDAFSSNDPFNAAFSKPNDGFSSDPFGNSFSTNTTKADPFDAFGDSKKKPDATPEPDKDPFGCDPFAVLHAPTRDGGPPQRPTSPSPALPPKKSKVPPPRPAPPRPAQPPSMKKSSGAADPFGSGHDPFSSGGGAGGFADFTDFDAKCLHRSSSYLENDTTQTPQVLHSQRLLTSGDGNQNYGMFSTKPAAKVAPSTHAASTAKSATLTTSKGLDFTCDPFRDYRYEDPFNIQFDDDTTTSDNKPSSLDALNNKNKSSDSKDTFSGQGFDKDDKFDPFGLDGRQSVPLTSADPFVSVSGRSSVPPTVKLDLVSEDQQLAWAARESLRLEENRKKRQLQEQADLELAIRISKAECNKQ